MGPAYLPYTCQLDVESLVVSRHELGEDEATRKSALDALKSWLSVRKWLKIPMDDIYLLGFLRQRKFAQLPTRQSLVDCWEIRSRLPQWYGDTDVTDPRIRNVLEDGLYIPMPGRDINGRKLIVARFGHSDTSGKRYSADDITRTCAVVQDYLNRDENCQVNGYIYLDDFTGMTLSHLKFFALESSESMYKGWITAHSGRQKGIHIYNGGHVFDVFFAIVKPAFPAKIINRVYNHHSNLATVYDHIEMSMLPTEYLPDEYTGPSAGTLQQVIDETVTELTRPEVAEYMRYLTGSGFNAHTSGMSNDQISQEINEGSFIKKSWSSE